MKGPPLDRRWEADRRAHYVSNGSFRQNAALAAGA
jgi:hypothetical protein